MDQNQITDNQNVDNDLQKAIDNITNTTNVDPVFSDPVAAPSSVPEGDSGELGEPVGPFPEPKVETPAPAPEPLAPLDPINIPDLNAPAPEPTSTSEPAPTLNQPAPLSEPTPAPEPVSEPTPEPAPKPSPEPTTPTSTETLNMHQVKEAALRDLVPLLDHLDMNASQKFDIYRNIFEELKDYTVLDPAYKAASEIPDDTERAEALFYLVKSIDNM